MLLGVIGCSKKEASPCVQNQMSPWCCWRVHSPSASSSQNGPRTLFPLKINKFVFISSYPLISLFKTRCNSFTSSLEWTYMLSKSRDEHHWWKLLWRMVLTMVCRCDCLFCPLPLAVDPWILNSTIPRSAIEEGILHSQANYRGFKSHCSGRRREAGRKFMWRFSP